MPLSVTESKSDTSGSSTIEDEDTETSEIVSENDDEYPQTKEEDEDAEAEPWYRDLGINRDEADEMFIEHPGSKSSP